MLQHVHKNDGNMLPLSSHLFYMQISSEPSDSISSSPVASPDLSKGVEGEHNGVIVQNRKF